MLQLQIPHIQEDILASGIRRQTLLCDRLIQELETRNLTEFDVAEKIQRIERELKRLCEAG